MASSLQILVPRLSIWLAKVVLVLVVVGASVVVVVVGMVVEVALVLAVVVLVLTPGARTIAGGGRGIKLRGFSKISFHPAFPEFLADMS